MPFDQYERTTAHLGERYQQFVILALGDIILVPTLQVSRGEFAGLRVAALFCAFAIMLLLWQVYVFRAGELLEAGAPGGPSGAGGSVHPSGDAGRCGRHGGLVRPGRHPADRQDTGGVAPY